MQLGFSAKQLLEENAACFDNRYIYEVEDTVMNVVPPSTISHWVKDVQQFWKYLLSQGILVDRISSTSYGEERPAMSGSGENAWEKNRRAVIE